eukprot:4395799-Ditylum_brightwellii.AAC.1
MQSSPISPKEKNVVEKSSWKNRFDELCAFKTHNGHCNVSKHDTKDKSLGIWVSIQRVSYKRSTLSSDRIQQLNSIGFIWDKREHFWKDTFDQLCAFKAQNGHCNVSRSDAGNKTLSQWVSYQRVLYKKNTLSSNRIEQLNSIGFTWGERGYLWEDNLYELCAFKAQNGHCNVSQSDAGNKSLGKWVSIQRVSYKKNTLSSDRIEQLNSIGFTWDEHEQLWKDKFDQLCAFKAQNGHCNVSKFDAQKKSLGGWVNQQRFLYKKNTLSSSRTEQLNSIGFIWDKRDQLWKDKFDQLCAFKAQNGHCNISKFDEQNKSLWVWVNQHRVLYKKYALSST